MTDADQVTIALAVVQAATRKLRVEQGPKTRRAARAAVRRATRDLLAAVDSMYPAPPRRKQRRRSGVTTARLLKEGWKVVASAATVLELRRAGAAVRTCDGRGWAREWALTIAYHCTKTELREAVRSPRRRAEILGRLRLEGKIA